ncbi:AMP-binding protein [Candidatus Poriferisocius sp.]|uniref:AMP-binding protein n=1 Tax=Candidatus Poriferisocius sp. TaxID=3101276 RepID=UPI003B5CA1A6
MTIGQVLNRAATEFGDIEAVVHAPDGTRLTFGDLLARVRQAATGLLRTGVRPGDRVGIWSPNNVEWIITQHATALIGAVLVNVNPAYRVHELRYALELVGCSTVIAAPSFKTSDYEAMIAEVAPDLPALQRVILLDTDSWTAVAETTPDVAALDEVAASLSFDDPINIQFTSGTTGHPKGATLTHHNIVNNARFVGEGCEYRPGDRICVPVPFYHCFGMVMGNLAAAVHGATVVIPGPAFEPAPTLQAVQDERCTSLYGVPTMFIAELALDNFGDYDLSSLRTGIMAGAPCPVTTMRRVTTEMHMDRVTICYGMTETSPVSTQTSPDDTEEHRTATVGRVHPHVEVQVVDPESGRIVPRGTAGEFCTRGYSVMRGYWNDPERTAEAIDDGGWMHTGDLAVMDDDGYVNIVGRIKDMIIRGGENIYPREIEEFLHTHPAVEDVQVIGVPDERYGEQVMAWVVLKRGHTATAAELRDFCTGKIAHFKVPRYVAFADDLPATVTGKIQKFKLRDMAAEHLQAAAGERD